MYIEVLQKKNETYNYEDTDYGRKVFLEYVSEKNISWNCSLCLKKRRIRFVNRETREFVDKPREIRCENLKPLYLYHNKTVYMLDVR